MPTATVTSKGQITIPKRVRDALHIVEGSVVEFVVEEGGSVSLRPLGRSVRELSGFLRRPGQQPVSLQEMDQALAEDRAADDERIRQGR